MKLSPIQLPPRPRGLKFEIAALVDARFEVKAEAATIEIFGAVGFDVTPARIAAGLREIGNRPATVQLNSPGGDPFDGLAIFNLLRGHAAGVVTQVIGIAASAASLIAMAGDRIEIARSATVMIHRASGGAMGDSDTMRQMATALDQIDAVMARLYQARTSLPLEQITSLMAAETFMSSDEAIALGFADTLLNRDAAPAPRTVATTMPSKRDFERELRSRGFSHSVAAKMVAEAWPGTRQRDAADTEIDLDAVADAIAGNIAAHLPSNL